MKFQPPPLRFKQAQAERAYIHTSKTYIDTLSSEKINKIYKAISSQDIFFFPPPVFQRATAGVRQQVRCSRRLESDPLGSLRELLSRTDESLVCLVCVGQTKHWFMRTGFMLYGACCCSGYPSLGHVAPELIYSFASRPATTFLK